MNSTQPLNVKNVGMVFGEFMKGQTKKGKPLSYAQLKEKYAPKLLEYANGLTQEASKLEKVKKIRDRLAQLDFEDLQRRQREQSDDHNIAIEQVEELQDLQQKARRADQGMARKLCLIFCQLGRTRTPPTRHADQSQ